MKICEFLFLFLAGGSLRQPSAASRTGRGRFSTTPRHPSPRHRGDLPQDPAGGMGQVPGPRSKARILRQQRDTGTNVQTPATGG